MNGFKQHLKRIWFDILMLGLILLVAYFAPNNFIPTEAKIGFFSLFLSKLIFINAGILVAHISRQWMFPYIDFKESTDPIHKIMIISYYVIIIYAFSHGG